MERASGQAQRTPLSDSVVSAPALRDREETLSCGECAHKLGKSTQWFREHLGPLYDRGMPRPIDQPGQRRFDRSQWLAWRRGFKGPKDAANDIDAPADPVTLDEHRVRLRNAYGGRS